MNWDGRIRADARHLPLADESVQCVVTSPPYWGLRDYGQEGQIGLEKTPDEYVVALVAVFREVWRVLEKDGTLWLNLGDSYYANGWECHRRSVIGNGSMDSSSRKSGNDANIPGLKSKDLVGIPWRVAFALQADGWYLRRDIIWHKPNPMPESVTDRPTTAHEYIFLLTKSERYLYDHEAVKEDCESGPSDIRKMKESLPRIGGKHKTLDDPLSKASAATNIGQKRSVGNPAGRNKRSVWTISTRPYLEAHYATFPEEIPEICIKAGSRSGDFVLDPFFGSGTVGRVAERLSRRWIGCDLGYQDLQAKRVSKVQRELIMGTVL